MLVIQAERRPNESNLDYHKRIVYGKLVDKTLSDMDYTELAELIYGQPYSSDVARRMMYGSRKTLELMDAEKISSISDRDMLSDVENKLVELRKERRKMYDYRNAFHKLVDARARQEELNEIIVNEIRGGALQEFEYLPRPAFSSDNDLLVSLNDIHFGSNVDNYWTTYNSDVCKEMMFEYLDRIVSIANTHNSENCIVWMNGDAISGNIHHSIAVTNKENVIQQVMGVSELISAFLAELSKHFRTVTFVSVAGNHSRISPNKDNAVYTERLDDLIEWYVSARLQNFNNILIGGEKIDETMYAIDIRGKTYLGVHGD